MLEVMDWVIIGVDIIMYICCLELNCNVILIDEEMYLFFEKGNFIIIYDVI